MKIELLVIPDCPHADEASGMLTSALDDIGLGALEFTRVVITSQADAERHHFVGSPTICLDGEDVFPEPRRVASVACRIYPGRGGVPNLRDLRQALKKAAASSVST